MSSQEHHTTLTGRSARADARRNRSAVLDAARRLFAEQGIDVPVAEVAKAAGVAVGTIYRHYPSKEVLIDAVVYQRLQDITGVAEAVVTAGLPTPFTHFFWHVSQMCVEDGRFATIVSEWTHASVTTQDAERRLNAALAHLLTQAHHVGEIQDRLDPEDLPILLAGVRRAAQDSDHTRWQRYVTLVLRGLRTGNPKH